MSVAGLHASSLDNPAYCFSEVRRDWCYSSAYYLLREPNGIARDSCRTSFLIQLSGVGRRNPFTLKVDDERAKRKTFCAPREPRKVLLIKLWLTLSGAP